MGFLVPIEEGIEDDATVEDDAEARVGPVLVEISVALPPPFDDDDDDDDSIVEAVTDVVAPDNEAADVDGDITADPIPDCTIAAMVPGNPEAEGATADGAEITALTRDISKSKRRFFSLARSAFSSSSFSFFSYHHQGCGKEMVVRE